MLRVAVGLGPIERNGKLDLYGNLHNMVRDATHEENFTIVIVFGDFSQFTRGRRLAAKLWLEGTSVVQLDGKTIIQMLGLTGMHINSLTAEGAGMVLKAHCQKACVDVVVVMEDFNLAVAWPIGEEYEPDFVNYCSCRKESRSYFTVRNGE